MQIVQRDERRRRVLADEAIGGTAPGDEAPARIRRIDRPVAGLARRYGESALMDEQPRITDLAPQRISTLVLLFLAGGLLIAGLECLYHWMPALSRNATDGRIAAFDLDDEGTLAAWFSSTLLSAAALGALLVYFVRRQRMDDYHGRYRIWIWAALCWMVMSIDETGSLHEGFKELMSNATGQRLLGDGSIWWVIPYTALLGTVGIRLLLEMRQHKGSAALLLLAGGCFVMAVLAQLGWLLPDSGARGVMLEEGCEMTGDLLLLISMLAHARYVKMEAGGELPAAAAKPKRKRKTAETTEAKTTTAKSAAAAEGKSPAKSESRADAPAKRAAEPVKAAETKKPAVTPASISSGNKVRIDRPTATPDHSQLSKAERKALRRQQQAERSERQR
ncbi:MAG: hypothetical protein AB7O62_24065 [Pirellulales bacterium]